MKSRRKSTMSPTKRRRSTSRALKMKRTTSTSSARRRLWLTLFSALQWPAFDFSGLTSRRVRVTRRDLSPRATLIPHAAVRPRHLWIGEWPRLHKCRRSRSHRHSRCSSSDLRKFPVLELYLLRSCLRVPCRCGIEEPEFAASSKAAGRSGRGGALRL
jgi:hypothetical protein